MTPIPAGWKLISSAPKDGTTVILGRDMGAFGFIRGYGYFAGTDGAFVSGWVSKGFCEPHGNLGLANPTHWMPLPAAPGAPASVAPGDAQDKGALMALADRIEAASEQPIPISIEAARLIREAVTRAPAAGNAQTAAAPEWMACEKRAHMVMDNLKARAEEMRDREKRSRTAYQQEYMGAPMHWLADVYDEAAAVFEAKLAVLAAQVPQQGEA